MPEGLRGIDPQRHPGGVAQLRGLGDRLEQGTVGGDLGQVHERQRGACEDSFELPEVDGAVAVRGEFDDAKPAVFDGRQVGSPLAGRHRHGVTSVQRPGRPQRLPGCGCALGERQPSGRDPQQAGEAGSPAVQHGLRFCLGHVGARCRFPFGVGRRGPQRRG